MSLEWSGTATTRGGHGVLVKEARARIKINKLTAVWAICRTHSDELYSVEACS